MKFFITGLCLQGNKGGPAIAKSLMNRLRREFPGCQFILSVPGTVTEWPHEKQCADEMGIKVVKNISLKHFVPPYALKLSRIKESMVWLRSFISCETVIQMSAISYIGPPSGTGKFFNQFSSNRFLDFLLSAIFRKKFIAWTQSYGPFSSFWVRFFAKLDLRFQGVIFCRGPECKSEVQKLLPRKKIKAYPDVAIILQPETSPTTEEYISWLSTGSAVSVTMSPSAVLFSRGQNPLGPNEYIERLEQIADWFISKKCKLLLVPHTFRPSDRVPERCDFQVSRILARNISSKSVGVVSENIEAGHLKKIIGSSDLHIAGRYHAHVAALSQGVPSLATSWHPKYRDLSRMYKMDRYIVDGLNVGSGDERLFEEFLKNRKQLASSISKSHTKNLKKIDENFEDFRVILNG